VAEDFQTVSPKLFGNREMAFEPGFFCGKKRPIGTLSTPVGRFRSPDSGHIPIFQTVSEGEFSEVHLQDLA
jgi:hypothetical protein